MSSTILIRRIFLFISFDCAMSGSMKIATYLLKEHHIDVNYINDKEETAMNLAARTSSYWFINFLLENGADPNLSDEYSPLSEAAGCGNIHEARILLKHGADINKKDNNRGETPFQHAVSRAEIPLLEMMMEFNPDLETTDFNGNTPLIKSIKDSYFKRGDVVSYLVDKGCNVNAKNKEGKTPLHFTCQYEMYDSTMLLFNKGADPNAQDNELNTPVHIAIMNKQSKAAAFLVKHGGNPNLPNAKGETPMSLAKSMKFPNLHKFFLQYGGKDE